MGWCVAICMVSAKRHTKAVCRGLFFHVLCRHDMPFLEKTADITMSGRHVGDMSATFPAKIKTDDTYRRFDHLLIFWTANAIRHHVHHLLIFWTANAIRHHVQHLLLVHQNVSRLQWINQWNHPPSYCNIVNGSLLLGKEAVGSGTSKFRDCTRFIVHVVRQQLWL